MHLRKPLKSYPTLAGEFLDGDAEPVDPRTSAYEQALVASDLDAIRGLIAQTPDLMSLRFFAGLSALHIACRCYHLASHGPQARRARADAIVQMLLDAGADPMAVDRTGQMPAAWGSTPALRERMQQLAEADRFPVSGFANMAGLGSSSDTRDGSAGRFDPGRGYSCAFLPVSELAFAPRVW